MDSSTVYKKQTAIWLAAESGVFEPKRNEGTARRRLLNGFWGARPSSGCCDVGLPVAADTVKYGVLKS
ncbi:hypothetical protein J6590_024543 [Homalodisca vitripennis]|nr:hypothetical protein J6590_024543 [Homalodisca vitripennis]